MASVAANCSEESRSFMMAEKAGRSLKLHIQQYLIRSYLKRNIWCVRSSGRLQSFIITKVHLQRASAVVRSLHSVGPL